ncbi:hypothetical protein GUITHDRAFT_106849 [Guillardia theta CCMP2712]|uniref:Uncharacterized protein n=1 Tax=Guillardia theta (strain CCMP2712) TaxID=905079 RepID=L1JFZ0_GUITC|nr:hypothetical protein GUITHDRAFT_106849 [Guillardia theta CCMP2712]EKX47406.1 hypothetical protein GUITHDRAFT_106849 [Guillardia theta CCMP2712]|eukprot:XP_005834386.1 hypothetical protein GUITHDRAFT_106849 [Guillardia theta CCMP2712]
MKSFGILNTLEPPVTPRDALGLNQHKHVDELRSIKPAIHEGTGASREWSFDFDEVSSDSDSDSSEGNISDTPRTTIVEEEEISSARSKRDEHGRMVVDATELAANRHPGLELSKRRGVEMSRRHGGIETTSMMSHPIDASTNNTREV